jgi:hypothetical protein
MSNRAGRPTGCQGGDPGRPVCLLEGFASDVRHATGKRIWPSQGMCGRQARCVNTDAPASLEIRRALVLIACK